MTNSSVIPRKGGEVKIAIRATVGVTIPPIPQADRGPAAFAQGGTRDAHGAAGDPPPAAHSAHETRGDACPSPRTRVSPRLVRELAKRGMRHLVPLLLVLATEAEGRACSLSQPELAEKLSLHVSNVRRQERILEQLGVLRVVRGGPNNRRLVVLENLDAQAVTNGARRAASRPSEVVHDRSTDSPHCEPEVVRPCAVSRARETAHEECSHIRLARARAHAEEPLSDSSAREPAAAPFGPWATKSARATAELRACRAPEWPGPSEAVDERVREAHRRLSMWPNTLRAVVIGARDHARKHGETRTLAYIEALERWCLGTRKKPAGSFYRAICKWTAKIEGAAPALRQHVLEDVGPAKHVAGILERFIPQAVRHA